MNKLPSFENNCKDLLDLLHMNIKRPALKDSTFEKWEGIYRNYIKPNKGLSNAKLAYIDTLTLLKITTALSKKHTLSKIKTMNSCL